MTQKLTPVIAIRKYCLWCMGGSRKFVRECDTSDCPLHPFRMGKNPTGKGSRLKAIRKRCLDCVGGSYSEVRKCNSYPGNPDGIEECPLWLFRFGKNPRLKGKRKSNLKNFKRITQQKILCDEKLVKDGSFLEENLKQKTDVL